MLTTQPTVSRPPSPHTAAAQDATACSHSPPALPSAHPIPSHHPTSQHHGLITPPNLPNTTRTAAAHSQPYFEPNHPHPHPHPTSHLTFRCSVSPAEPNHLVSVAGRRPPRSPSSASRRAPAAAEPEAASRSPSRSASPATSRAGPRRRQDVDATAMDAAQLMDAAKGAAGAVTLMVLQAAVASLQHPACGARLMRRARA